MSVRQFYFQLFLLSVLTAASLYGLHQLPDLQSYSTLSWISLLFFVLLSIVMFHVGYRAARSENKKSFTQLVMVFTVVKMMLAVLIILIYIKWAAPVTKWFVLPFFGIYMIYTIFETYFMMRLGKMEAS